MNTTPKWLADLAALTPRETRRAYAAGMLFAATLAEESGKGRPDLWQFAKVLREQAIMILAKSGEESRS